MFKRQECQESRAFGGWCPGLWSTDGEFRPPLARRRRSEEGKNSFFSESALPAVRQAATPHTLLPTCRWRGVAPPSGPCLGPDSFCDLEEITCPLDPVSSPVSWGGVAAEWHLLKQGFKLDMRN